MSYQNPDEVKTSYGMIDEDIDKLIIKVAENIEKQLTKETIGFDPESVNPIANRTLNKLIDSLDFINKYPEERSVAIMFDADEIRELYAIAANVIKMRKIEYWVDKLKGVK